MSRLLSGTLLWLLAIGCGGPESPAGPVPPPPPVGTSVTPPTLTGMSVEPLVVPRGGTIRISASVSGPRAVGLQSIVVDLQSGAGLSVRLLDGTQVVSRVTLRDDGAGGDETAGDGRFTSGPLVPTRDDLPPIVAIYLVLLNRLEYRFPEGTAVVPLEQGGRLRLTFYDVEPDRIAPVGIQNVGPNTRRTPHVIAMALPPFSPIFPSETRSAVGIARAYYEQFDYDPDFLLTYQLDVIAADGLSGFFGGARNDVTGVGGVPFDQTVQYGSPGGLQGAVVIRGGPSPSSHGLLVHELGHHWMARVDPDLGISTGAHWGPFLDREFNGFVHGRYNDFELYLMGLVPPDSVLPRRVGINGVTLDQVIARHGERAPAWPESQNRFTSVALVAYPRLLSDLELALFDYLAAEFGRDSPHPGRTDPDLRTFFQATGGRARITTLIPDDAAR